MDQATTEVMWPLRPRAQAVGVLVDGVLEERDWAPRRRLHHQYDPDRASMTRYDCVIDASPARTEGRSNTLPGMRTVSVSATIELAPLCRFRDCTHAHKPGCAVQAAVAQGLLDPETLSRWRKLERLENPFPLLHPWRGAGPGASLSFCSSAD
jgi:hypothetical protein